MISDSTLNARLLDIAGYLPADGGRHWRKALRAGKLSIIHRKGPVVAVFVNGILDEEALALKLSAKLLQNLH